MPVVPVACSQNSDSVVRMSLWLPRDRTFPPIAHGDVVHRWQIGSREVIEVGQTDELRKLGASPMSAKMTESRRSMGLVVNTSSKS